MRIASPGDPHLSYCTNIHPGESLAEVRAALETHVPRVKRRLGVSGPFGVGLRLSGQAALELGQDGALEAFLGLLSEHGLYVFTINGFPHGAFHGTRVKEAVYRPDWREDLRVQYTDRLAWLLAALLPGADAAGKTATGSISSVPGAFRERARTPADAAEMSERVLQHAATLFKIREATGRLVELALEPEPCCFLETTDDAVSFFQDSLFSASARSRFSALAGVSAGDAETFLRRHVGVCLDACHLAVEFESATSAVRRLSGAGIRIGKIQVTTALVADLTGNARKDEPTLAELERFSDGVYLHQVVERRGGNLVRHLDLPDALSLARATTDAGPSEWRVHFHVPVFAETIAPFRSTQPFLRDLLDVVAKEEVSQHLEVETYTWDVLPAEHRALDVDAAIAQELRFTLDRLGVPVADVSDTKGTP
jgi:sugar phosphate isomerase/epimerase